MPSKPKLGKAPVRPLPQVVNARREYAKVPTRTKAEDPASYTKEPHAYGDILIKGGKLGGQLQRDLLYWIMRYTFGTNISRKEGVIVRPEYAKLSITALANLCQVWDADKGKLRPVERKSVAVALADLERRKIIEARERKGCGKTTAKMYKPTPEHWKTAPPYVTPTPAEEAEAEAEAEQEEESPAAADRAPEPESTVEPGRISRPQAIGVNVGKNTPAVTIRVVYRCEGFEHPVTFRSRTGRNGRVQITATPHRHSEKQDANYGCAQLQSYAFSSPVDSPQAIQKSLVNDYSVFLAQFVPEMWGVEPSESLINLVVTAAQGTPVGYFAHRARLKFPNPAAARKHKPGLLPWLAAEAIPDWEADQKREKARQTRQTEVQAPDIPPDAPDEPRPPAPARCPKCKGKGSVPEWSNRAGVYQERPAKCKACGGSGECKTS